MESLENQPVSRSGGGWFIGSSVSTNVRNAKVSVIPDRFFMAVTGTALKMI